MAGSLGVYEGRKQSFHSDVLGRFLKIRHADHHKLSCSSCYMQLHRLQAPYLSLHRYWARHPPSSAAPLARSGELVKKEHPGKMSKSLQGALLREVARLQQGLAVRSMSAAQLLLAKLWHWSLRDHESA